MEKKAFLFFFLITLLGKVNAFPFDSVKQIHDLISSLNDNGEFNGSILVASRGKIVYTNGFGVGNFKTGEKFISSTASCIASVTKQFTAVGIMMLAEKHKLGYEDPVTKYVELPECYDQVTIRNLLTHTSGVFEYSDLGSGRPDKLIFKTKSLHFPPGQRYEYSNSNYVLLSIVIEKITGLTFSDFLKRKIFEPLVMTRTFPYPNGDKEIDGVAVGYNQFGKLDDYNSPVMFGDGGLYSTVEDLLKWDQALYTETLLKQSTLAEAFRPGTVIEGTSTYGFGWNIGEGPDGKYVWHTGNTAGFRAYIQRRLDQQRTIIILTNTGPSKRVEIAEAINAILDHRPYVVPKRSGAKKLYSLISQHGIDHAMGFYDSVRQQKSSVYDFAESDMNLLGYFLLYDENNVNDAIKIFKLNAEAFPSSSNVFDSLGEAYVKKGDKQAALKSYQRALEIDPDNLNAAKMLQKIK
jgi:CubicO group peptidase (beta-lactamase class C family)